MLSQKSSINSKTYKYTYLQDQGSDDNTAVVLGP